MKGKNIKVDSRVPQLPAHPHSVMCNHCLKIKRPRKAEFCICRLYELGVTTLEQRLLQKLLLLCVAQIALKNRSLCSNGSQLSGAALDLLLFSFCLSDTLSWRQKDRPKNKARTLLLTQDVLSSRRRHLTA